MFGDPLEFMQILLPSQKQQHQQQQLHFCQSFHFSITLWQHHTSTQHHYSHIIVIIIFIAIIQFYYANYSNIEIDLFVSLFFFALEEFRNDLCSKIFFKTKVSAADHNSRLSFTFIVLISFFFFRFVFASHRSTLEVCFEIPLINVHI